MDQQDRLALEFLNRELATNETRIYEHVSSMFRWLLATLFAANGGATLALLSNGMHFGAERAALAWFAAGIILSLVMGMLSAFMSLRVLGPLTNAKAQVHVGLITGDTAEAEKALKVVTEKQKMNWKLWSPTYAGLASFGCFVAGVVTLALPLIR